MIAWSARLAKRKVTDQRGQLPRAALASAILFVLGLVSGTLAFNEPDGFRGVPWGATEDALRDKLGEASAHGILWGKCAAYPPAQRWIGDRYCTGAFPLGGTRVDALYTFRDNRFVGVTLTFPSTDFDHLTAIFSERYGPPTSRDNQIDRWDGERITITIQRGAVSGRASLGLREVREDSEESLRRRKEQTEESERLRQQQIKDAAKDL